METLPLKLFYMIRHGETVANEQAYAAGSLDTPLTAMGRRQAEEQRPVFEALVPRPACIVHSHLTRAIDTANLLNAGLQLPISTNQLIAEQNYGLWARRPWDEVLPHLKAHDTPPNGESHAVFVDRVMNGLAKILSEPLGPPLIVTHGGVFAAFVDYHGYLIEDVRNCHLYAFIPRLTPSTDFPWEIWHYERQQTPDAPLIRTRVPLRARKGQQFQSADKAFLPLHFPIT